jgi:hypothetical protein
MTNQTIAPEADGSPQKLMLYELAFRLVPIHCQRRDEAIDVQDGGPIPPEWQSEFEKRRADSIKRELAARLSEFDLSDPFIASHYLGVSGTEFDAWQERTPDWAHRIAQVRKNERRKYEADNRKAVENRAPSRVASQMAGEPAEAATIAIDQALRREMMATTSIVRVTSDRGEPRELNRAEIAKAGIDHVHNSLEIRGRVWCDVEVECKSSGSAATPKPKSKRAEPVDDQTVMTWLQAQISERRKKNQDTIRPTMIWAMRDRFRAQGLTRQRAGKIYGKLPKPYKGTPGPSPKSNTD